MVNLIHLYINMLLSFLEDGKITHDDFHDAISLLDDEIRSFD